MERAVINEKGAELVQTASSPKETLHYNNGVKRSAGVGPGQGELVPNIDMAVAFLGGMFGSSTTSPIYLSALVNQDDRGIDTTPEKNVMTRDAKDVRPFMEQHSRPMRGLFFCVGPIRQDAEPDKPKGSKRSKKNVAEIAMGHADVDLKGIDKTWTCGDVEKVLLQLECPPTAINRTGHGNHAFWALKEGLIIEPGDPEEIIPRVELLNDMLRDMLSGDAVSDVCRLMRLPGGWNTKRGGAKLVETVHADYGRRYELDELEAMVFGAPVLIPRRKADPEDPGSSAGPRCPWMDYADKHGWKPPIDVEARLKAMKHQGPDDTSIHRTQLSVTASMLGYGLQPDDIVETVLLATQQAVGGPNAGWDWRREAKTIRDMVVDWERKQPDKIAAARKRKAAADEMEGRVQAVIAAAAGGGEVPTVAQQEPVVGTVGITGTDHRGNVIHLDSIRKRTEARKAQQATCGTEPDPKDKKPALHHFVAETVLSLLEINRQRILVTEGQVWLYDDGLWSMAQMDGRRWLDAEIEKSCVALHLESTIKLINETRALIMRDSKIYKARVKWDDHAFIPTRSGLVNPDTLEVIPNAPENYTTWRLDVDFDPEAECHFWLKMLDDCFADRSDNIRAKTIQALQEAFGCSLVEKKPKALNRAIVLQGGSNYGKSEIVDVLAGLFGDEPITTNLDAIDGTHGTMPFLRRAPWVLHEAFDQNKWHFSKTVKAILSGDPIEINPKNAAIVTKRVTSPVIWATNHPPQFRESTAAIVNRMVVIKCRVEFDKENPTGVAADAISEGYSRPHELILSFEKAGLLMWAIRGLQSAKARGFIEMTDEIKETLADVRADSNMVTTFIEDCVSFRQDAMVSTSDFCAAFAAWWGQEKGEDHKSPSNASIGRAMAAFGDPRIAMDRVELRDNTNRYYAGITFNAMGMDFWRSVGGSRALENKAVRISSKAEDVNRWIPADWIEKRQSVKKMRAAHEEQRKIDEVRDIAQAQAKRAAAGLIALCNKDSNF